MQQTQSLVPEELKRHRYPELDALRGLAALTVVFHHLLLVWGNTRWYSLLLATPLRLFFSGPQAVTLFFVLSGFVLSGPQSAPRTSSYGRYLLKRLCRIYLPFLAALLLAFALDQHLYLRSVTHNQWFNGTWSYRAPLWQLAEAALTNLTYAQLFNTAFWSVFLEIQISMVFPLLFSLVRRSSMRTTLLITLAMIFLNTFVRDPQWFLVLQALPCFLVGILAYLHLDNLKLWMRSRPRRVQIQLLLLALLAYTYCHETVHLPPVPVGIAATYATRDIPPAPAPAATLHYFFLIGIIQLRLTIAMAASLLLILGAISTRKARQLLSHPVLLRVGALSYSIYLVHGTVLFAMLRTLTPLPTALFIVWFLVLVYAASELFHFVVDAPSVKLGRLVGRAGSLKAALHFKSKGSAEALPLEAS